MACTVVIPIQKTDASLVLTEGRPPGQRPSLSHAAIRNHPSHWTRVKEPVRDWRQCRHTDATRTCNRRYEWRSTKWPMVHPKPTVNSIPSYASVGNGEFVCASCVPKLKLSSSRARLIFSQDEVVALPLTSDSLLCGWPLSDLSERIAHIAKEVWYLGAFQWYVACWCIIYSQAQTATSTRKSIHHMEPGCKSGSITRLCHQLSQGTAVAYHCGGLVADALTTGSQEKDPGTRLYSGRCSWGSGAQRHPRLLFSQWRLAKRHPQWCTRAQRSFEHNGCR